MHLNSPLTMIAIRPQSASHSSMLEKSFNKHVSVLLL